LTTKATPCSRHTLPSASRSTASPKNENTQLVQNSLVAGVIAASSSAAVSAPPAGRTRRTRTPRRSSGSQVITVAGKSPSTSSTSSPRLQGTPWTSRLSP
jgi:hypothetical protein